MISESMTSLAGTRDNACAIRFSDFSAIGRPDNAALTVAWLSRDSRAAQRRNANRRAIIDAATALEIALGRHVRGLADQLPETQRRRISERTALGDYISIAEHSGLQLAVPVDRLRWLNNLRNDAAHRGAAPGNWKAGEAVQVMIDFLGAHGRFRRTGEREPDGGEWVLADSENAEDEPRNIDDQ